MLAYFMCLDSTTSSRPDYKGLKAQNDEAFATWLEISPSDCCCIGSAFVHAPLQVVLIES